MTLSVLTDRQQPLDLRETCVRPAARNVQQATDGQCRALCVVEARVMSVLTEAVVVMMCEEWWVGAVV